MKYIYITDVKWNGNDEPEDVMLFPHGDAFAKLTPEIVSELLKLKGWDFNECYWVKSEETQYFIYSPCWLTEKDEADWIETYETLKANAVTLPPPPPEQKIV